MLKQLSSFIISLILLSLLAGVILDIKGCCDPGMKAKTEISEFSTPCVSSEGASEHCPAESECHQCCGITCAKVVPHIQVALVQPMFVKIDLSYLYNFSHKTTDLSTPQKPPRV